MQKDYTGVTVRSDKSHPRTKKYPFELLAERGDSFFLAGADAHRVRQAARSYQRHHPEIGEAGDTLRASMDKSTDEDRLDAPLVDGTSVYRIEKEE